MSVGVANVTNPQTGEYDLIRASADGIQLRRWQMGTYRQQESLWCYEQQPKHRNRYREYAMGRTIYASSFDSQEGQKIFPLNRV
jgi:hypothetical protein